MTSREIVERLINQHVINGEEAFTLINDICKNEMYDVWKTLEGSKINTTTPNITWTYNSDPYTISSQLAQLSSTSGNSTASAATYTVKSV